MKLIEPRTLKGFRDYLPREQISRARFIEKIKVVFERFGFEPLETPVLEYEDVLTGKYGEEGEMLMYRFQDHGKRKVAMRYDLTVPLARVTAQYQNDLPKPFKRYQIAPVWRADNTQKGRYREFYQCDADIVGAEIGIADAECIAMIEQILLALGIQKFTIKISNRKLLNAVMLAAKIPATKIQSAIRSIDKLEKIGAAAVAKELVANIGIKENEAEAVIRLVSTKVPDVGAFKAFANEYVLKEKSGKEGFEELNRVFEALEEFGVKNVEIDLSLARGLDYYTSTIYEAVITETPEARSFGSVTSGGRYDKLLNLFTGKDIPAVGMSVGIDRLFAAMEEMGLIENLNVVDVLVLNLDQKLERQYLQLVSKLRKAGINSELYYEKSDFKKQFSYAEKKAIPYAVVLGENEAKKEVVLVRNLKNREQETVKIAELVKYIKKVLKTA
jgi:histidyl-tRNA synthetase